MTPAVMAPIWLPEMLNVGPERLRDEMDSINTSTTHYGLPRRRAKSVAGTARGDRVFYVSPKPVAWSPKPFPTLATTF